MNPLNPLTPFTYYRRHKRAALLLIGLIALVTIGVYALVGVLDSMLADMMADLNHLTKTSLILDLVPEIAVQIRMHPDIAHVVPILSAGNELLLSVPSLFGREEFRFNGVREADLPILMAAYDVRLKEGRLPQPYTNEIVLSEEVARPLSLHVGDRIGYEIDDLAYENVPVELHVVGILEGHAVEEAEAVQVGFISYEYLDNHELFDPHEHYLIIPQPGRKAVVDTRLVQALAGACVRADLFWLSRTHGDKRVDSARRYGNRGRCRQGDRRAPAEARSR